MRMSQVDRGAIDERKCGPDWIATGDRVRMSALGLQRHPKFSGREGLVVGIGSPNSLRVKFDGLVTAQAIYRDYLVKAPARITPTSPPR
jgi:hypothetical protein